MTEPPPPPLPPDIAALLRADRARDESPPDAYADVLARLAPTHARQPGALASRSRTWAGWLGGLLLLAALGAYWHARRPRAAPPRDAVAAAPSAAPPAMSPAPTVLGPAAGSPNVAPPAPPNPLTTAGAARRAAPRTAPDRCGDLSAENALLTPARLAVRRGDPGAALAAVGAHQARCPHGRLVQEREAIAVRALVLRGDRPAARARAARFRREFPTSPLLPAIERTLGTIP